MSILAASLVLAVSAPLPSPTARLPGSGRLYFNREAFLDAIAGDVVIDFEDAPVGPVVGDPWADLGVVFDEAGATDGMWIGDGGGVDRNLYAGSGWAADIDITLTGTFHAFGLGVFNNEDYERGEQIVFRGAGGAILATAPMPLTKGTEFVGYIANEPILRVEFIEDDGGDYVGIGDVAFGFPNPPTLTLGGPTPGSAGSASTLSLRGATPGERVLFAVGHPGQTRAGCPDLLLDLAAPRPLGSAQAAPDGSAAVTFPVPPAAAGLELQFQALEPASCAVSNSLTHLFL